MDLVHHTERMPQAFSQMANPRGGCLDPTSPWTCPIETARLAIDNTGAAAIALDPAMRSALKHVSRRHYFVRDMYEAGEVLPTRIGTLDNIADLFTKPLPPERHTMLAARLRRGSTALAK